MTGPRAESSDTAVRLTTRVQASDLIAMIMGRQLTFPAVVVTRPSHLPGPLIPLLDLSAAVDGIADTYYVDDSDMWRAAVEAAPGDTAELRVFGGAARVFPAGRFERASLFIARTEEEGARRVGAIRTHLDGLRRARGSLSYSTDSAAHDPARREADSLRAVMLQADVDRLEAQTRQQEAELARLRSSRSTPAQTTSTPAPSASPAALPDRRLFDDAAEEVEFRLRTMWAVSTSPAEKIAAPLPHHTFAPGFADSIAKLAPNASAGLVDKVARCALRVLLNQERDAHRLDLSGAVRADGAVAWRAYVEQNVPSARRLHYWRIPGGEVEFARVVLHDDYRI